MSRHKNNIHLFDVKNKNKKKRKELVFAISHRCFDDNDDDDDESLLSENKHSLNKII